MLKRILVAAVALFAILSLSGRVEANNRITAYFGAQPSSSLINTGSRFQRVADGALMQALLGTTGGYSGLTVAPSSGLYVTVGPSTSPGVGSVYQYKADDTAAWGGGPLSTTTALAADPTLIVVQGQLINATTSNIGPLSVPGTSGQTQDSLIECQVQTIDSNLTNTSFYTLLGAYTSANVNTERLDTIACQAKAGVASTSPTVPTVDTGWIGVGYVAVPYGTTTLTTGMVTMNQQIAAAALSTNLSTATIIAQGESQARTLPALFADSMHSKGFVGVLCNGTNDDTLGLQNAINAAAGVARLYIDYTGSNCVISSALNVPSFSQIFIDNTIFLTNGSNSKIFNTVASASQVVFDGEDRGILDGNAANQTSSTCTSNGCAGINVSNGSNHVWIRGLKIQNTYNWPINVNNASYAYLYDDIAYESNTSYGNSVEFTSGTNNCWADKLNIQGIHDGGFTFYRGVSNCGITNSISTGNLASGIGIDDDNTATTHDIIIANNIISGTTNGVGIPMDIITPGTNGAIYNVDVEGNHISGNYGGGIRIGTADTGITVAGNTIYGDVPNAGNTYGIDVKGSWYHITGNKIFDEGVGSPHSAIGIYYDAANANGATDSNYIYDDQGTPTMEWGLSGTLGLGTNIQSNSCNGFGTASCDNTTNNTDTIKWQYGCTGNLLGYCTASQPILASTFYAGTSTSSSNIWGSSGANLQQGDFLNYSTTGSTWSTFQATTGFFKSGWTGSSSGTYGLYNNGLNNAATVTFDAAGDILALGQISAGSATGATLSGGDLGASRSTTTGKLWLGGSSYSCGIDYGVTTALVLEVPCSTTFTGTTTIPTAKVTTLNQSSANQFAQSVQLSAGVASITYSYSSSPVCTATEVGTAGRALTITTKTNTGLTVTSSVTTGNTDYANIICVGNPN